MKGTFYYDEKSKKFTLKRDDGKLVDVIDIALSGDAESTVFDGTGEATQYEQVGLWTDDKGECILATADRAPREKSMSWGKRCAKALAIFAPLSRLEMRAYYAVKNALRRDKHQHQTTNDSNQNAYRYRMQSASFMKEFLFYWSHFRFHAVRGWWIMLGVAIGCFINCWLLGWF